MTDAEILRKMAAYIREHKFSPDIGYAGGCGCFIRAHVGVGAGLIGYRMEMSLTRVIGTGDLSKPALIAAGWTLGKTDDAAAACEIAACLVE